MSSSPIEKNHFSASTDSVGLNLLVCCQSSKPRHCTDKAKFHHPTQSAEDKSVCIFDMSQLQTFFSGLTCQALSRRATRIVVTESKQWNMALFRKLKHCCN